MPIRIASATPLRAARRFSTAAVKREFGAIRWSGTSANAPSTSAAAASVRASCECPPWAVGGEAPARGAVAVIVAEGRLGDGAVVGEDGDGRAEWRFLSPPARIRRPAGCLAAQVGKLR